MDIGVWFDLRNPPGWRRPGAEVHSFTLEACEEAERLGLHSEWFSEHHAFEDGYLPQPLTFAAAVAARTNRIRIGTAVTLAPLRSSVHIAEEAAVVDLISNGRLDLGMGAGYRPAEFALFGVDFRDRFRLLDEHVREVRELWLSDRVTPRPTHGEVPIWVGLHSERGAHRTGQRPGSSPPGAATPVGHRHRHPRH
jgi:alkanesulfonate monooxygenase SsuD/methylene tetrahydromethanopterin reductase-like flavin-dependent oxidoreductase (luciferase family)